MRCSSSRVGILEKWSQGRVVLLSYDDGSKCMVLYMNDPPVMVYVWLLWYTKLGTRTKLLLRCADTSGAAVGMFAPAWTAVSTYVEAYYHVSKVRTLFSCMKTCFTILLYEDSTREGRVCICMNQTISFYLMRSSLPS